MSWDDYIDNLIEQSRDSSGKAHIDKACIIGLERGNLWTTHKTDPRMLELLPNEGEVIANCFKKKDFTGFSTEIRVAGFCYIFLREIDNKMVLAKRSCDGGITMQASKAAVIIAHTCENGQQGNTNKAVAKIANYLESVNM